MSQLINLIHIQREYSLKTFEEEIGKGPDSNAIKRILNNKFDIRIHDENQLEIKSWWSVGTMIGDFERGGIKIIAELNEVKNIIKLGTVLSSDLNFITGSCLLIFILMLFINYPIPIWIYPLIFLLLFG
ncbi:MAG: hypothetical protein AB8F74_15815, partial [Saprospiraceae bacterium]